MKQANIDLIEAIKNNNFAQVKELFERFNVFRRPDINGESIGHIPLHECIFYDKNGDRLEMIKYLLKKGADIEIKNDFGRPPLINAIIQNKTDVIEVLIKHGANLEEEDKNGRSPLEWAITYRIEEPLKILLKHGANLQTKMTALSLLEILHKKDEYGDIRPTVEILLEHNINIYQENFSKESPFSWAQNNPDDEIAQLILQKAQNIKTSLWLEENNDLTSEKLADLKKNDPQLLQSLVITGELLKVVKEQLYEQQLESYKVIKDILPPQQKKEIEEVIRSNRIASKGKE